MNQIFTVEQLHQAEVDTWKRLTVQLMEQMATALELLALPEREWQTAEVEKYRALRQQYDYATGYYRALLPSNIVIQVKEEEDGSE